MSASRGNARTGSNSARPFNGHLQNTRPFGERLCFDLHPARSPTAVYKGMPNARAVSDARSRFSEPLDQFDARSIGRSR